MSRNGRRRSCRPLTIYGFRRRRSKVHRGWVFPIALLSLMALPGVIQTVGDRLQRPSKVRNTVLSHESQSIPQSPQRTGSLLASAQAEADVVSSAEADTAIVPSDAEVPE